MGLVVWLLESDKMGVLYVLVVVLRYVFSDWLVVFGILRLVWFVGLVM